MDVGFETIGNATVICHDGGPVLVTDPWVTGGAYFGSWTLSHQIPEEQMNAIKGVRYAWVSHGHPDHLSSDSLNLLKDKKILVPNHEGGRIAKDLKDQGFAVHVLEDRTWVELSPRIRVMTIPDYNQDAVLLIDVNGTLVVNLNDAGDRGWGRFVRNVIKGYRKSFLLALSGYGDADMINYFDEDGRPIPPHAAQRVPVGQTIARQAEHYGVNYFVPFSSMHRYQRKDSIWADKYTTQLGDYANDFQSSTVQLTPAFIRYDAAKDQIEPINPPVAERTIYDPEQFGDNWDERLEPREAELVKSYFKSIPHLHKAVDFINVKVGGEDHRVELRKSGFNKGITFEAPRNSLVTAVRYEVFDDLLIGNFMKTTLHGKWGPMKLYPDFTPYVAKYSDNGKAKTEEELDRYFQAYRKRDPLGYFRHQFDSHCVRPLQEGAANLMREKLGSKSRVYSLAKEVYWKAKRNFL